MNLREMNCVVTGVTGGTGPAIVEALAKTCASIVGVVRGKDCRWVSLGNRRYRVTGNVLDPESVKNLVKEIVNYLSSIHVWINVVGGFAMEKPVEETNSDVWYRMYDLNFNSVLNCCRQILPLFKKQRFGRIINFGAVAGINGMKKAGAYGVSKAAVINLTKTIALEGKDDRITANVIIPNIIDTPANRRAMPDADFSQWTSPREVAETIVKLIGSDRTGEIIRI